MLFLKKSTKHIAENNILLLKVVREDKSHG